MSSSSFKSGIKAGVIVAWVVASFFMAQTILVIILKFLVQVDVIALSAIQTPLSQLILIAVAYSLALVVVMVPYYLYPGLLFPEIKSHNTHYLQKAKEILGVHHKPLLKHVGWVVLGYGAYVLLSILFATVISALWPGFNAEQAQSIGFENLKGNSEIIIAFIALAFIPPFVEELLFRGFLFGKLRQHAPFWVSTIITSLVFGFVHLQWNVGVDVFALSLVLCYLRHRTGTIWASIALHMVKNTVAFALLFLYPDLLKSLI